MLDPLCRMSSNFPQSREIVRPPQFQSGNRPLPSPAIALTLDSVTCYFQWS